MYWCYEDDRHLLGQSRPCLVHCCFFVGSNCVPPGCAFRIHDNWARRDRSRKDFLSSFRSKLPLSALSLLQHREEVDRPVPACHEAVVRRSCEAFYATSLDRHVATCEKQRKLFSKVLGLYPATSSEAFSFKKRKLTTAL
eukprot:3668731-Amphidinium_carterae.7